MRQQQAPYVPKLNSLPLTLAAITLAHSAHQLICDPLAVSDAPPRLRYQRFRMGSRHELNSQLQSIAWRERILWIFPGRKCSLVGLGARADELAIVSLTDSLLATAIQYAPRLPHLPAIQANAIRNGPDKGRWFEANETLQMIDEGVAWYCTCIHDEGSVPRKTRVPTLQNPHLYLSIRYG
jgi:hypothetical protein